MTLWIDIKESWPSLREFLWRREARRWGLDPDDFISVDEFLKKWNGEIKRFEGFRVVYPKKEQGE